MSTTMRAKLQIGSVLENVYAGVKHSETLHLHGVCKNKYDETGLDEDNTFAKMSPSISLSIAVANPALWEKFKAGEKLYLDFSPAE
jgi:hypothetical protein